MRVIIIEDEKTAAAKLAQMLSSIDSSIKIEAVLEGVEETVDYLKSNVHPQLAFVDIQLADDVSFEIFKTIDVQFPVIFTTAYDDYIIKALELNSIDYLLKPIVEDRLKMALGKVKKLETHFIQHKFNALFDQGKPSKSRFLVKKGIEYVSVSTHQIAYFFTEHKIVFLKDRNGEKYIIDKTIAELQELLDQQFFRINRKYIAHIEAIKSFKPDNGKLLLTLEPNTKEEIIVSKENAPHFRQWIEGQ